MISMQEFCKQRKTAYDALPETIESRQPPVAEIALMGHTVRIRRSSFELVQSDVSVFTAGIVLIAKPDEYNFKSFLYKTGSNRVYFGLPLGGNIDVDGELGSQAIWCGFKIDFVDDKIIFPGIEVYDRRNTVLN